jgi:hypothetical protein
MIELVEGFWVEPDKVTVVKAIDKDRCAIWVDGQSALDGFTLDYPADEVVEALNDELYEDEEEDDDDE